MGASLTTKLLIDSSAWARMWRSDLPDSRADEVADDFMEGRLAVCLPFILETGCTAQNGEEHATMIEEFAALPAFPIDAEVERRAAIAQAQLARVGHHRVSVADLVIAAIADRHEVGILHYDQDFDLLLEMTALQFHSEWLMPRGSLN